mgnify:CR=1 FL=1
MKGIYKRVIAKKIYKYKLYKRDKEFTKSNKGIMKKKNELQ